MARETGTRVTSAAAQAKHGHSLISDAKFRQLYEVALRVQLAGEREQRLRGREASLAGVTADMLADDVVIAEFAASVDDIARGRATAGMDRRSFEERVIAALSDAVGDRMRKTGRITAIFFDAAPGSKVLQEARSMAIAARLPVMLVEYGTAKPNRSASKKKKSKPAPLEYPSIPVDTQDVIAMYRVAHESIARAREGNGPTHIVGVRWQMPTGSARKRATKRATQDAVTHLEEWLVMRGLPAPAWRREIVAAIAARDAAPRFAAQNHADDTIVNEATEAHAIA